MRRQCWGAMYHTGLSALLRTLSRHRYGRGVTILFAHRVPRSSGVPGVMDQDCFHDTISWLMRRYAFVSMREAVGQLREGSLHGPDALVLTLDDGYADNFACAYPVVKALGIPMTVFVSTHYIGTNEMFIWDEVRYTRSLLGTDDAGLGIVPGMSWAQMQRVLNDVRAAHGIERRSATDEERMLSREELICLATDDLVEIGAHTVHHERLSVLPNDQGHSEITQSADDPARITGVRPRYFAYPYGEAGSFGHEHMAMLEEGGFEAAVTTIEGLNRPGDSVYELKRIPLFANRVQLAWHLASAAGR